jgi:hypothetical protein
MRVLLLTIKQAALRPVEAGNGLGAASLKSLKNYSCARMQILLVADNAPAKSWQ